MYQCVECRNYFDRDEGRIQYPEPEIDDIPFFVCKVCDE